METPVESNVLMAVVQAQDAEIAEQALKEINIDCYQMPSVGGFLGRQNVTLLIHSPQDRNDEILDILRLSCCQRVEFAVVRMESPQYAIPAPTQISVGGAAVFELTAEKIIKL